MDILRIITLSLVFSTANHCSCELILPSFHWNHRNTIFKGNNPGEQKKLCREPAHIYVDYGSEFYFICPNSILDVTRSENRLKKYNLFENIHMVNEKGFKDCKVDRRDSLLLTCDQSMKVRALKFELIMFHRLNWNGWSFKPNNTYYFINTSNGTRKGLDRNSGGRCQSHNMKLKVTVCHPEQKCSKCKGMCCEKPPTTKPPTTTATTTKKTIPTTHLITTTKLKAVRSESVTKSSSPRHAWARKADSEHKQETEAAKAKRSKSSTTPKFSPQPPTTASKSMKEQSGPGFYNCSGNVRSSNQIGGNSKDSSAIDALSIVIGFGLGVGLSALVFIAVKIIVKRRKKDSPASNSKKDICTEDQMPQPKRRLLVEPGMKRLQSCSSSDSGCQDVAHV